MAKCFIQDTTLTAIGDAIRAKTGRTDLMLPSAMPDAITGIVSGGGSGNYIWSVQHAGEDSTIDRSGGTYTLTTPNDSRPNTEIEYSLAAARYNAGTKKWEFEESTVVTLVNTDNVVPEMEATLMFVRLTSEPNIIYRINGFNVGTMTVNNTYEKSMTIVQKRTYSLDTSDISFIADDDSMKYPDGGWLDGLYYTAFDVSSTISDWAQSNVTSGVFSSVYYANGVWVACGYGVINYRTGGYNGLWYSTDGITWTQSNVTDKRFCSVYYGNGLWVAAIDDSGSGGNAGLWYSTDGMAWNQSNNYETISFWSVYYANGLWVAGSSIYGLYYSIDGMTWTLSNLSSGSFKTFYYGDGIWVAGSSDKGIYYSTDGMTWTQSNVTDKYIYTLFYSNGVWVAGCYGNNGLYYSTDGMTWTLSNVTSGYFNSVYYDNGIWVAGCNGKGLYYSTDGMTWTQSNKTDDSFDSVYYANGIWVAGGSGNGLYYSTDGMTWTQSNQTSGYFNSVYYGNGVWVSGDYGTSYNSSYIGTGLHYSKITQRTLTLTI